MKGHPLFSQHRPAPRLNILSFLKYDACFPGVYGCRELMVAKEYVWWPPKISLEKIKDFPFVNPKIPCLYPFEKQGVIAEFYRHVLRLFNTDIQWITNETGRECQLRFPAFDIHFSHCDGRQTSLLNNDPFYVINVQAYEHLYRLRSLFDHAPRTKPEQKRQDRIGVYFRRKE